VHADGWKIKETDTTATFYRLLLLPPQSNLILSRIKSLRLIPKIPLLDKILPRSKTADSPETMRTSPNVIVTGTPGVGKTVHCEQLAQDTGLRHLSINKVAKDRDCFESYDDELASWIIDEDKVRALGLFR
jgi:hypothetical protein